MLRRKMISKKFILLIFIHLYFTWGIIIISTSEFDQLLSIKSSLSDPLNSLSTWNNNNNNNSYYYYCQWHGISCDEHENSSHVTKIELPSKNLSGKIPNTIFQLPFLETIDLSDNKLFGEIPKNLSYCLNLKSLNLSNNNITGSIPTPTGFSFINPHLMETFDLSNNMIFGKIPEDIGLFSGLKILDFGGNLLDGTIPKSIKNVTKLEFFTLDSNQLSGEIPPEISYLKNLKWIYLGHNNFTGGIPKEIGELNFLFHLDLVCNNLTGEIPLSLGNLTNLEYLFLYLNKLNGSIPPTIFNLKSLISLDLSGNLLSGEIPHEISQLQNLEIFNLFSNNFTGQIPKTLIFLPHLKILQLWSNKFSGEIPENLGRYNNLSILDLSTNNLTGKIPESVCFSGQLSKLILFSNQLQGGIPKSLGDCKSLTRVRLENNLLSGEFFSGFTQLPVVYYLDVSGNNLFGKISALNWRMPELQMLNLGRNKFYGELPEWLGSNKLENLDLSENELSGRLPKRIGKFSELVELKLSRNKLFGEIPDEISLCKKLVSLDLSYNRLTGDIPSSLCDMPVLGILDLSVNQLSGEIPSELGNVGSLVQVNVSHNHFQGSLPLTGAFLAINSSAVAGNHLCGGNGINSGLPPCKSGRKSPSFWWFILSCIVGIFVTLALVAYVIFVTIFRPKKDTISKEMDCQDGKWELQFFNSKASKSISILDIMSSTTEENQISNGKIRALYKGQSMKNNMKFIAKTICDTSLILCDTNWKNLIELGCKINHPNIVKLFAACRSGKKSSGILVMEYIDGKDLNQETLMNWACRKKVAIGIIRALKYLHGDCSPSIRVGDLNRKIIVDKSGDARLRLDFLELICTEKKVFLPSPITAPESTESKIITDKTDIYEFGLLLIELLTGRNPADKKFGVHESIVEWVRYCYSDCHLDMWVDPTIKIEEIKHDQNQLVETMLLALHCTADNPLARPSARKVAKAFELIAKSSPSCL